MARRPARWLSRSCSREVRLARGGRSALIGRVVREIISAAGVLLALAAAGFAGSNAVKAEAPVILPKVLVEESVALPTVEPWRHARWENFEILAQTGDAITREVVRELSVMPVITQAIWPGAERTGGPATLLVLCRSAATFDQFVPAVLRREIDLTWIDRLFLERAGRRVIVLHFTTANDFENVLIDLRREFARASMRRARGGVPDWFATGMAEVVADAAWETRAGKIEIAYAKLDEATQTVASVEKVMDAVKDGASFQDAVSAAMQGNVVRASLYDRVKPSPAALSVVRGALNNRTGDPDESRFTGTRLRFNQYFTERPRFPSLAQMLVRDPALNPDDDRMLCWYFVYRSAFSTRGYRNELAALLATAREPGANPVAAFEKAFRMKPSAMELILASGLGGTSAGLEISAPFDEPAVAIEAATAVCIGRCKAEALLAAGHDDAAGAEWDSARRSALADLRREGNRPAARTLLELGRVELARALAGPEAANGKLSAAQTAEILGRFFPARAQGDPPVELYEGIAETWAHSAAKPRPEHLAVLLEGVNRYAAAHPDYLYRVAELYAENGFAAEARPLAALGLKLSRGELHGRFAALAATLPAGRTPP
jgi:hypothetical protein